MSAPDIRWVRATRVSTATRTDGLSLTLHDNAWRVYVEGGDAAGTRLSVAPVPSFLDRAIERVDEMYPPAPWSFKNGVWTAGGWSVTPGDSGYIVVRNVDGRQERASRQVFPSPDRARRWAQLRFDRSVGGLRGPKPRAGSRSGAKLPDVRVTEAERDAAVELLESLDMPYAVFVRAAMEWTREHVKESGEWTLDRTTEPYRFVRAAR